MPLSSCRFYKNDRGATAIEYALVAALVSVIIVTAVTALGTQVGVLFSTVAGSF